MEAEEAASRRASQTPPPVENDRERAQREELAAARQERVEELQALTLGAAENAFVSKSRDVDQVVTTLHRSNDVLRKQKAPQGGPGVLSRFLERVLS